MNKQECDARGYQCCLYNLLLTTVDIPQRRAYEEIHLKILTAVGLYFPAGLTFLTFEHTMTAEEVPMDPRVFIF
ncbi:hypothetical protein EJ02DRAFT_32554 [Clathrospora elynae]|uniref:Uncharacterized protein n=1 Tax=Clathrospora elynae TaxID=706981 RepID=A0A6A5SDN9_9PLEO|nr:hypothetical protein EJ02DRAFT_32554 [Clathrospora elynae]